jgi:hypothetical protein
MPTETTTPVTPAPVATPITTPTAAPVTPITPQPVSAPVGSSIPVDPVKPKSSSKPLLIVGCLLLLCIVSVLAGFGIYRFVYLPNAARDFVNNSETSYKSVRVQVGDILDEVESLYGVGSTTELMNATDLLEEAKSAGEKLRDDSNKAKQSLPNSSPAVGDLREELAAYYDITSGVGESYAVLNGALIDFVPILKETGTALSDTSSLPVNSVAQIQETIRQFDSKASELEKQQKQLPTVDAAKYPEIANFLSSYNDFLTATIKFFRDSSKALNQILQAGLAGSQAQILEAQVQFNKDKDTYQAALTKFTTESKSLDKTVLEAYQKRVKSSEDKAKEIDTDYSNIRSEYGLK